MKLIRKLALVSLVLVGLASLLYRSGPSGIRIGSSEAEVASINGEAEHVFTQETASKFIGGFTYISEQGEVIAAKNLPPIESKAWMYVHGLANTSATLIYFDRSGRVTNLYTGGT